MSSVTYFLNKVEHYLVKELIILCLNPDIESFPKAEACAVLHIELSVMFSK